jgi:hypothetical protein
MCEKHNNIHKTVQNTFQHETVDLKTPLQDLQLKFIYPYNVEKMRCFYACHKDTSTKNQCRFHKV